VSQSRVWRSRWGLWALPLAFLLLNAVVFLFHPGRSGAGFAAMERELAEENVALLELREKRAGLEAGLQQAELNREGVRHLYEDIFSTTSRRLTRVLSEVKRLAARAGFSTTRLSYPEREIASQGLISKSIVFHVEGDYAQLRTLLNLLEMSEEFLVLEQVRLQGSRGSMLSIDLLVTTLFAAEEPRAERRGA
jgi:hypothetical protein